MENSKWIATAASIWIQCSCSASYAFGIYSAALKSSQGYDQSTLDTVFVFKDIGANIGVLSGLLYDAVTDNHSDSRLSSSRFRSGLSIVYLAGAVQCFAGYFLMWLSVTGVIYRPHVLFMCLFMFMAAQAQTFFNTENVVVAVRNFPDYSGTTVGIMNSLNFPEFKDVEGANLVGWVCYKIKKGQAVNVLDPTVVDDDRKPAMLQIIQIPVAVGQWPNECMQIVFFFFFF